MQFQLVGMMYSLWESVAQHGYRAAQFVDLLGYFSVKRKAVDENHIEVIKDTVTVHLSVQIRFSRIPLRILFFDNALLSFYSCFFKSTVVIFQIFFFSSMTTRI